MALARNKRTKREAPTPGFAIAIKPATDLGLAMLIAETDDGHYEPVAVVSSVAEAREIASGDFARRLKETSIGREDVTCPARYAIWAQGLGGDYKPLRDYTIDGTEPQVDW